MAVNESDAQPSFSIFEPRMTVEAMRDSGYRSTTHALAELIDNSIESGATAIEMFGVSRRNSRTGRFTLEELAVLDDGEGMDGVTLRGSLRYGHGTRRERRGIGRFGLGLPNSSQSQAKRVDVWSWRSGVTNAFHTRLYIEDVERGAREIPEPELRPIPTMYREASRNGFGDTGTLVVWSELDEVFGVTNNKQGTMTFQRLARYDWRRESLPGEESAGDVRRRMEREGDHRVHLLDLRAQIEKAIAAMRPRVREARQRRSLRHVLDEDQKADAKTTAAIRRRIQEGHTGESDRAGESGTDEEHRETQAESLVQKHHLDREDALRRIDETIKAGSRVRWIQSAQSSPAFFDVESLPNVIQVALNTEHPVHRYLYEIMHPDVEEMTEDEVRERLARSAAAFRILIYSWARYEEEQTDRARRQVRDARFEWGKYAEEFFDEDDDTVPPTDLV